MTRFIGGFAAVLILYFIYGFYVSQQDLSVVPEKFQKDTKGGYYDYRGVLNVHTSLGRGSATPQAVINVARNANLDFLIVTDLNQFSGQDNFDGYHGPLLVMQEAEYSYLDSRVFLLTANEGGSPSNMGESSVLIADYLSQSNSKERSQFVGFLHTSNPDYGWTGTLPQGMDGLEIINSRSIAYAAWAESKISVITSLLIYPFNPLYSFLRLYREPERELALWDEVSRDRPLFGFAGAEASARAIPLANYLVKFPSYRSAFSISSNHVLLSSELTGNFKKDQSKLMSALKKGQFYFAIDLLGDPQGFFAEIRSGNKRLPLGSEVRLTKGLTIYAELATEPKYFYEIVLLKDGQRSVTSNSTSLTAEIREPGTYRLIVRVSPLLPIPDGKKWITWIFANPFFIKP